jgi:hypothetical protein
MMEAKQRVFAQANVHIDCPIPVGQTPPSVDQTAFTARGSFILSSAAARGVAIATGPQVVCQVLYPDGSSSEPEAFPVAGANGNWMVTFAPTIKLDDTGNAVLIAQLLAKVNGTEVVLNSDMTAIKILAQGSMGCIDCSQDVS